MPSEPQDRRAAQSEEFQLEREASEHRRDEIARNILAWGMWILMIVVFAIIILAIATLGFHLLAPETYHWLDKDSLRQVRSAVLSGAVVGLGTTYLRRYLQDRE